MPRTFTQSLLNCLPVNMLRENTPVRSYNSNYLPPSANSSTQKRVYGKFAGCKAVSDKENTPARSVPPSTNSSTQQRVFGEFVLRKAVLDVEYQTVAALRADYLWKSADLARTEMIDMESTALKRECTREDFMCLITVKKESIVGAMDLIVRLSDKEIIQTEVVGDEDATAIRYVAAYATNLVVDEEARRGRLASNILDLATYIATLRGMETLYLHVAADNHGAIECYKKLAFQVVRVRDCKVRSRLS